MMSNIITELLIISNIINELLIISNIMIYFLKIKKLSHTIIFQNYFVYSS